MPRIRTIKPDFWDDLKISKVSRDARLLYIGMWNFADDMGIIVSNSVWLKSKIFPYDQMQIQQFEKLTEELVKHGFISLFSYKKEEFYYLPNLTRHQVINRPNYDKLFINKDICKRIAESWNIHGMITEMDVINHTVEEEGNRKGKGYKKESANADKKESELSSRDLHPDFLKFNCWMEKNAPYCYNPKNFPNQITEDKFFKLKEKYNGEQVAHIISQIENRKDLRKRYTDLYRTVLNWAKKEYG